MSGFFVLVMPTTRKLVSLITRSKKMADIEITQKEIEDKLFSFIEENFGRKRYECFNEVVNFVEYEIISILSSNEIQ